MFGNRVFGGLPRGADPSNPYSILGISVNASDRQIQRALAKAERRQRDQPLTRLLSDPDELLIARAALALYDPALRRAYDAYGAFNESDYRSWLAREMVAHRVGDERCSPVAPLKTSLRMSVRESTDSSRVEGIHESSLRSSVALSPRVLVICQELVDTAKIPGSVLSLPHADVTDYAGSAEEGLTVRYTCDSLEQLGPVRVELDLHSRGRAAEAEYLQMIHGPSPPAQFLNLMEKTLRGT
jgi:hypothetical protein